ncbi:MAG: PIN domain-containing protein [Caldilineaceae bacterium]|nr:PIN domain-containing protein [Caldilineaceae bacterium]
MSANALPACFVDTNIWLYAFIEADDAAKSARARQLLQGSQPVVSTQVINEICVNLLKRRVFTEEQIRALITSFYEKYEVVELTPAVLLAASALRERYSLSFWDSLIVAGSLMAGVGMLYSEDMQHGLIVDGKLQILNPFLAGE